jgi:2-dehydropantoate 2-reductase
MRVLVFGAGVLGSLYAGRLAASKQDVALLARGSRLEQLRRDGLVLFDEATGIEAKPQLRVVDELRPEDVYDLIIVMVRTEQTADALPLLSTNQRVPSVLFLQNNAPGPTALAAVLGRERVLLGFPVAGGALDGPRVRYRLISEQKTTLGELDGSITPRLRRVREALSSAGFPVALSRHMDAWLKTHGVFITAIAGAIYSAQGSCTALVAQPDGVPRLVRAVRQGFRALRVLGTPIAPRKLAALFLWLPLPVPMAYWRRYLGRPEAELIFGRHAQGAVLEMLELVNELRMLLQDSRVSTPDLDSAWRTVEHWALLSKGPK